MLIGGACFLGGTWLSIGLLFFYFTYLKHYRAEVSPPPLPIAYTAIRCLLSPACRAPLSRTSRRTAPEKVWELNHYYWIDKSKGQVALPIEQAMQMLAQRGIPPQKNASECDAHSACERNASDRIRGQSQTRAQMIRLDSCFLALALITTAECGGVLPAARH